MDDHRGKATSGATRQHAQLSQDLGTLIKEIGLAGTTQGGANDAAPRCDVLIVGSGYGGAVSAATLAGASRTDGKPATVWLLERGQEYLPGQFPTSLAELPGHVRFSTPRSAKARGVRTGLFDVRLSHDVSAIVANGLGGGSLINAGVMAWPSTEVGQNPAWPQAIQAAWSTLSALSDDVQITLGAKLSKDRPNTVGSAQTAPMKFRALAQMAGQSPFAPAALTVALQAGTRSSDGIELDPCIGCGDCATGCNHNAKISLDTNLLARAQRLGVRLFTGATVLNIAPHPSGQGWLVEVVHTATALRERQTSSLFIHTRQLILAAGTFGTTEILMRSQAHNLPLSPMLGQGFSANGDLVGMAYGQRLPVQAIAREDLPAKQRQVGPTITGMIDLRAPGLAPSPHVIQDLAVPAPMHRLVEELFTTAHALHGLSTSDTTSHSPLDQFTDPMAVDKQMLDQSSLLAVIGHDDASGRLEWVDDTTTALVSRGDGAITVKWPALKADARLDRQMSDLQQRCNDSGAGGRLLPNPAWRPLPSNSEFLVGHARGSLLTAHPLGGCRMADHFKDGVVNHLGQVWRAPGQLHEGLVVLDGAMIPSSLGINPALTIATLAQWATPQLMAQWRLTASKDAPAPIARRRSTWRVPEFHPPKASTGWITERMRGKAPDGVHGIELTLRFQLCDLRTLSQGAPRKSLVVDEAHSHVRVVKLPSNDVHSQIAANGTRPDPREEWDQTVYKARVSGTLDFFHREASEPMERRWRSAKAWFFNRGLSDAVYALQDHLCGTQQEQGPGIWQRIKDAWHLSSRAGEVRLFDYELCIGETLQGELPQTWNALGTNAHRIQGRKRLTYERRSNPIKQLTRMSLLRFPGLPLPAGKATWLDLDLQYLAEEGLPLMRVADQEDMPTTLFDVAALLLWMLRVTVNVHVWSLRKPSAPSPEPPKRQAGRTSILPEPETFTINVGDPDFADNANDPRASLVLCRYKGRGEKKTPILLIHGYSTSSSTFAHEANQSGLAGYLWKRGHDVWLVDLRTSSARDEVATHPWKFEDMARYDIPCAIDNILAKTGEPQLDVFAHCMGSAMFWMSLLGRDDNVYADKIHRLCMSQVAPIIYLSPATVLRSFVMRYAQHLLPMGAYRFRRIDDDKAPPELVDQLFDRLLAALPYPRREFDIENPWCPPWKRTRWVGSRHRMDALYGHDMNIEHLDDRTLNAIDDLFGPLNLTTVAQVMHIARHHVPTNKEGEARYLFGDLLARAPFPMMSIHGTRNDLSDITGMYAFEAYLRAWHPKPADIRYELVPIPGYGHQDCLIGKDAPDVVFKHVARFFG